MRNYVKLDFMYPQHEFLLNRATLTYLNWKSKLHQLMQSSLRSSWNLNDRREKSWRWQRHCFWNPKVKMYFICNIIDISLGTREWFTFKWIVQGVGGARPQSDRVRKRQLSIPLSILWKFLTKSFDGIIL